MFSIKSIALFATLLCSSLSLAAPAAETVAEPAVAVPDTSVVGPLVTPSNMYTLEGVPINVAIVTGLLQTRDEPPVDTQFVGIEVIFTTLQAQVSPLHDQLLSIPPADLSIDNVQPIIDLLVKFLGAAVEDINLLVGQPINVVLRKADNTVMSLAEAAGLIGNTLNGVFLFLELIWKTLMFVKVSVLITIGALVGKIVVSVGVVVTGLLDLLLPIVLEHVFIIKKLCIKDILTLAGIGA
jgi:hypothetical protein